MGAPPAPGRKCPHIPNLHFWEGFLSWCVGATPKKRTSSGPHGASAREPIPPPQGPRVRDRREHQRHRRNGHRTCPRGRRPTPGPGGTDQSGTRTSAGSTAAPQPTRQGSPSTTTVKPNGTTELGPNIVRPSAPWMALATVARRITELVRPSALSQSVRTIQLGSRRGRLGRCFGTAAH